MDYSPFEGTPVSGRAEAVWVGGEPAVEHGAVLDTAAGKMSPAAPPCAIAGYEHRLRPAGRRLSRGFGEENKLLMKLPGGDDLLDRAFAACPPSLFSRAAAVSFSREILARPGGGL